MTATTDSTRDPAPMPPITTATTVDRIMTRHTITVGLDDTLEHIRGIFQKAKFHHVIVLDQGRIAGVISDRDLLKNLSPFIGQRLMERVQDVNTLRRRAHQVMTRSPVTVPGSARVQIAAALMLRERVSCLPVVDASGRLIGIVTSRDLLRHVITGAAEAPRTNEPRADAA
ncbi:MAG: CBS domain-containing protein [Phycisphaeraceae bacterium]|nr:CBS domain-containing protein [Phycisphaeraceae bacterium]